MSAADHLSVETMAKCISGEVEPEEVYGIVLPHLLARCATCRQTHAELHRLLRTSHHCDLWTMWLELQDVPGLSAQLGDLPFAEQLRLVEADEAFHTWMFCRSLAQQSLEAAAHRQPQAVPLAALALAVSHRLGSDYDDEWVHDLRVECRAYLAHALHATGDLAGARREFAQARADNARGGTGIFRITAEIDRLEALLHREQGNLPKALALYNRALAVFGGDDPEDRDPALARQVRAGGNACRRLLDRGHQGLQLRRSRRPDRSARSSASGKAQRKRLP